MSPHAAKRVLLIGWDAADWKVITPLLDAGLMPTLNRFVNEGVMGNLASIEPMLSPMLWTSIATGKRPEKHGIHGFIEPTPDADGIRRASSTSRTCKAVWNILTQAGLRCNVVGWYASHPAEPISGACVSDVYPLVRGPADRDWPLPAHAVHPPRLEPLMRDLRVHPAELSAGHLLPFVPLAAKVDQEKDRRLASIAKMLAECSSVHNAATWLMEHEPWDFTAVYYDTIDHFSHGFMHYHPPRMADVPEEDFELYKDVVAGCYRYHDMMLERLLELAGDDTLVILCSDHGFHSDHLRPAGIPDEPAGPAVWHRRHGIVCVKGPGVVRDERLFGASLLDITPTILTALGLPVGDDMDGRPLLGAFAKRPKVERIASWEDVAGDCGMHPAELRQDPVDAAEAVRQLVALGYVEPPGEDRQEAVGGAIREARFNLARSHMDAGRFAEAAALLQPLAEREPGRIRFVLPLAQCRYRLGELAECRRLVESVIGAAGESGGGAPAAADLLLGVLGLAEGDVDRAIEHLGRAEQAHPRLPQLHTKIGGAYLRAQRWADAERALRRALDIDMDCPHAYHGLAMALLAQARNREAAEASLRAVGLLHHMPQAHFHLGVALARLGWTARARLAFLTCLSIEPGHVMAKHWLRRVSGATPANAAVNKAGAPPNRGAAGAAKHRRRASSSARPGLPQGSD